MKLRPDSALIVAMVCVLSFVLVYWFAACGADTGTRVAHVSVVTAGTAVASIDGANRALYTERTDALRERLRGADGSIEDYDREVAPIDHAFAARGRAIQAMSASLYSAAAVVDATRRGAARADYAALARDLLGALSANIAVLRDGAVLPALPIPAEIDQAIAALRAIASRGVRDAGH